MLLLNLLLILSLIQYRYQNHEITASPSRGKFLTAKSTASEELPDKTSAIDPEAFGGLLYFIAVKEVLDSSPSYKSAVRLVGLS